MLLAKLKSPWLFLPPEWAHHLSPLGLSLYSTFSGKDVPVWNEFQWRNIHFKNPLGIAGGVDKDATLLKYWSKLGAGFVEVGTITPEPQNPNSGKIIDRDLKTLSVWNKMGFPSVGMQTVLQNYQNTPPSIPVFFNIGKNRNTPNEHATADYLKQLNFFASYADLFVINISSPNTVGLRELLKKENLSRFLEPLIQIGQKINKPLLLKVSPDLSPSELESCLKTSLEMGIDGFVLTNTTTSRLQGMKFPSEGGVSGAPLKELSIESLKLAVSLLGSEKKDKLIISAGGVLSAEDVFERLRLGANLVEIYSALIFKGPSFFHQVAKKAKES